MKKRSAAGKHALRKPARKHVGCPKFASKLAKPTPKIEEKKRGWEARFKKASTETRGLSKVCKQTGQAHTKN